ncbi:hypothetical protein ON010_g1219 [Phytophthora cinnamomi]|nr:hypothetical protein ON010_g1219 [Phytophthora cinnamomi]
MLPTNALYCVFHSRLVNCSVSEDSADLKVHTTPDVAADGRPQSSPSNATAAHKASPTRGNSSPTARSDDRSVTSPHPAQTEGSYSTDLFRAFPKVCQKAKSGVQLCQAVSAFVTERAALESNYAQSLLKLAQSTQAEDWSEQLTACWATFQEATDHLAQERWAFASTMQTAIVPGAKAFAAQQEIQVQRLITVGCCNFAAEEGTKVRWAQQQMTSSMDKAREKYERKCQEAIEITSTMRKSDNTTGPDVSSSSSDSSSDDISSSKELTDKLAAGAGQLLTKMWDTTSAFGRNPLERQRSKLYSSLEEVIAAEKHYVQTVEYTNAQRLIFEREIKENLHAFQLTEEQRLEYLRDVLVRMQKAFVAMFSRSQQFVERMKESVNKVDELADIEKGFQSLGGQEDVDVDRADLSINPFYLRMTHIQAMSDDGQRMIGVINSVVTEFISIEARFSQALRKLLRTHESGGLTPPSDLFGTSSSNVNLNFLADEGATMANGWLTAKDQVKLLLEVHQHKLDTKSRDFAVTFSYMPGSTPVGTNSYGIEVAQALKVLSTNLRLFNEKERRSEAKLRQLAEEIRMLQVQVSESSKSLRQTYQIYVQVCVLVELNIYTGFAYTVCVAMQEIEVFISTYMKNEKYRLQVGKNSLQSLAKAVEHMLQGGTSVGNKALVEFEKIDPNGDIAEFVRINRQPYERSKRIVPAYHGNESLKEVMREYLSSPGAPSENSDKNPRSPSSGNYSFGSISSGELVTSPEKSPRSRRNSSVGSARDDQTAPANGNITTDENHRNEDESAGSGMEQDEEFAEAQPLGVSDFQKKFKVASFSEISLMEKKNTALIVPNAIEFTVKGEKVFFTSFVFRDECFQSIQQLRSIKKETEALMSDPTKQSQADSMSDPTKQSQADSMSDPPKQSQADSMGAVDTSLSDGESRRRRSSDELAAVAPSPGLTPTNVVATEDCRPASSLSSGAVASLSPVVIPEKDGLLCDFDLMLDEEVAFSVDVAFSKLWIESDAFAQSVLDAAGSTNISIPPWDKEPVSYTAVSKPDSFDGSRLVSYTHNKKYMVGPSVIPTAQTQRYAYSPGSRLVVSTTTCVSDVPYCDYFRVEHRWVFSATKKASVCLAQVGLRIQWSKSTWLKKQIESTTASEAKDAVKSWLSAAIEATKQHSSDKSGFNPSAPASTPSTKPLLSTPEAQPLKDSPQQIPASSVLQSTTLAQAATTPTTSGPPTQLHPTLQAAVIICALMFIYTMYRVCAAMDQMQALTRESLVQQRQQQEVLRELLARLG